MVAKNENVKWTREDILSLVERGRQIKARRQREAEEWLVGKLTEPTFRVDPYDISPSGDDFFADSRNVEAVQRDIDEAHKPEAKFTPLRSKDDVMAFINQL